MTTVPAPVSIGSVLSFGQDCLDSARAEHLFESVVDQRFIHGYPERSMKYRQVVCTCLDAVRTTRCAELRNMLDEIRMKLAFAKPNAEDQQLRGVAPVAVRRGSAQFGTGHKETVSAKGDQGSGQRAPKRAASGSSAAIPKQEKKMRLAAAATRADSSAPSYELFSPECDNY